MVDAFRAADAVLDGVAGLEKEDGMRLVRCLVRRLVHLRVGKVASAAEPVAHSEFLGPRETAHVAN